MIKSILISIVFTTLSLPSLSFAKGQCQNVAESEGVRAERSAFDPPYICSLQKRADQVHKSENLVVYYVYTQCKARGAETVSDMYTVAVEIVGRYCGKASIK